MSNDAALEKGESSPKKSDLFADFARYFELSIAQTDAARDTVYAVRYSVYCEEFGYEDTGAFEDCLESDVYDDRSIHCLVTHKASGTPAGCVRLVLSETDADLPFETHCGDSLDADVFNSLAGARVTVAEISRLAVDGRFRRRRGEQATRFGNTDTMQFSAREKRTFSLITVSLFLAATAVAELSGRRRCFAMMEPFLPTILRRTGVIVKRVGGDIDFRGVRAPYSINLDDVIVAAPEELKMCYRLVKEQFATEMAANA